MNKMKIIWYIIHICISFILVLIDIKMFFTFIIGELMGALKALGDYEIMKGDNE